MKIEEFLEVVKTAFPSSQDILTQETYYKELSDWNSMTALILITTISEGFNVNISPNDAMEYDTLGALFEFVNQLA